MKQGLGNRVIIILLSFWGLFSGCFFDGGSTNLTENYDIRWIDIECSRTIYYGPVGQMKGYIYDVTWDDKYILAKRHPNCNQDSTDYYIIDIKKNNKGCQDCRIGVFGPLDKNEFESNLDSIGINSKLKHHKNFK